MRRKYGYVAAFVLFMFGVFPAGTLAFSVHMSQKTVPGVGAAIEIRVSHDSPFVLTYAILFPKRGAVMGVPFYISMNITDPGGKRIFPFDHRTCDVNFIWFGGCETVPISRSGETLIVVTYPLSTLHNLGLSSIEATSILITNRNTGEKEFYTIPLSDLIKKAHERPA